MCVTLCPQIPILCRDEAAEESAGGRGAVEECLKLAMEQGRITVIECLEHVAEIVETQRADIHADPVLHQACAIDDTKFCSKQETGKRETCLLVTSCVFTMFNYQPELMCGATQFYTL